MEGKLKILMTADTVGGVWSYAMALCRELKQYDAEIHLLTMGARLSEGQNKEVRELDNVILYESELKLEWMEDAAPDIKIAREWIADIYKAVKPDIIHFNNYSLTVGEWDCSVVTVFHSCVCTWFRAVKGTSVPPEWERYRTMVENAVFASDIVVFPSFAILGQAKHVYGPISHAQVVYNGISQNAMSSFDKQPFILTAGRLWDEAKNIQLLSRIAGKLDWPVLVAGNNNGPKGSAFERENVTFLGNLTHNSLQKKMQEASIFVSGAFYEPFGLAVLEAAASGCALALSDISSFREIWGDAAVYFDPDSNEQAAACISELIENETYRKEMGNKARLQAQQYSSTKMAENYISIYKTARNLKQQPSKITEL
jgi:glycosyltransferase involved in cell wall biosynthesis